MPEQVIFEIISLAFSISYQQAQARKMREAQDKLKGSQFTVRNEAAPLPVVYGKQKLGGIQTKIKVKNSSTAWTSSPDSVFSKNFGAGSQGGSKNEFLFQQIALCFGGIEGVQHILVDGIDYRGTTDEMKENNTKFNHRFEIFNDGGTANPMATNNGFPSTNTFTNAAYATNAFKLNRDNPQYSGVPSVEYLVKGRKVRKITESGGNYTLNTTYVYSNNPAYVLLDYLLNDTFGRGLTANDIDLKSFFEAAAVCDTVAITNSFKAGNVNGSKPIFSYSQLSAFPQETDEYHEGYLFYAEDTGLLYTCVSNSGTPTYTQTSAPLVEDSALYECNITLDTSASLRDNILLILDTMNQADLNWTPEGKYKLIVNYPQSQSAVDSIVQAGSADLDFHKFTEDDIIQDSIEINWPSALDRYNHVTVNFQNEFEDFKDDSVSFPKKTDSVYTDFLTEDNNIPLETQMNPPGITNLKHALAYAEEVVRKSRSIYSISFTLSKRGLTVEPGDLINIIAPNWGINSETIIRVESIKVTQDLTVKIEGYRFDYTTLAWNTPDLVSYNLKTDAGFEVEAPASLTYTATNDLLGAGSGSLSWPSVDFNSVEYIVEVSDDNQTTWKTLGITRDTSFDIQGLQSGVYNFAVRTKLVTGSTSDRVVTSSETIQISNVLNVFIESNNGTAFRNNSGTAKTLTCKVFDALTGEEITTGVDYTVEYTWSRSSSGTLYVDDLINRNVQATAGVTLGAGNYPTITVDATDIDDTAGQENFSCSVSVT